MSPKLVSSTTESMAKSYYEGIWRDSSLSKSGPRYRSKWTSVREVKIVINITVYSTTKVFSEPS